MRKINNVISAFQVAKVLIVLGLFVLLISCTKSAPTETQALNNVEPKISTETLWHVKAIHPEGRFLDIKAVDAFGNTFDINASQDPNQKSCMDVKAYVSGKILPVKLLVNDGKFAPVKAIAMDGTFYNLKAIALNGDRLALKGVKRSGNIIHIKVVDKNGSHYAVKAISPTGQMNDVKGIKINREDLEYNIYGFDVYAHIKALPQTGNVGDNFLWHIVSIHPDGYTLEVKAIDKDGNTFDVKAIQDSDQRSLLDIKAFIDGSVQLPVKLIAGDDEYKSIKAIGKDGILYDIMAISPDGDKLEIKGVGGSENIINIKAINEKGEFYGIKAISPEGELNDVKGVKLMKQNVELKINGVEVYAHVKALSQVH